MIKRYFATLLLILYSIAYFYICVRFTGLGYTNENYVLISTATFLYGIFIAFSIFSHQNRLSRVRELLRTDDAYILSIYRQSAVFGEKTQAQILELIDEYLMSQIDYRLGDDYHDSTAKYRELSTFIINLKPETEAEKLQYQNLVTLASNANTTRKLVGTLVKERTTNLEWFSIVSLHALIAYLIFSFNTGTVVSAILSTAVVSTGAVMLIVLYQLNTLSWQEDKWVWAPLSNLFLDLNLLPYYPDVVVSEKRAKIKPGSKVRICHYKHPYPDMRDKEVKVIEV